MARLTYDPFKEADEREPELRRAFMRLESSLRASVNDERALLAIAKKSEGAVLAEIPLSPVDAPWRRFERQVRAVLEDVVVAAADAASRRLGLERTFTVKAEDPVGSAAIEFLRTRSARLVKDVTDQQRAALRRVLSRAFEEGRDPANTLESIMRSLGQTERDAEAADRRYRAAKDAGVSETRARRIAGGYARERKAQRAKVIARTETAAAQNVGQSTAWTAALQAGQLPENTRREWVAVLDQRTSELCQSLDGTTVGMGELFQTEDGQFFEHPPAHPNCRSTVVLVFGD